MRAPKINLQWGTAPSKIRQTILDGMRRAVVAFHDARRETEVRADVAAAFCGEFVVGGVVVSALAGGG
jgi:hypothetical protein